MNNEYLYFFSAAARSRRILPTFALPCPEPNGCKSHRPAPLIITEPAWEALLLPLRRKPRGSLGAAGTKSIFGEQKTIPWAKVLLRCHNPVPAMRAAGEARGKEELIFCNRIDQ